MQRISRRREKHIFIPKEHREEIKENLNKYLSTQKINTIRLTGFIKYYAYKRQNYDFFNYPINCLELKEAVYKEHNAIKAAHESRRKRIEDYKQTQQYQKDLKNLYLERGEYAAYEDLSSASQPDLSGYVGKESAGVISKETQQDLHTTQNKNQPQQVRQVGQVEQVGLVRQVGQAQKSQNNVKQKAKTPNSAAKR